MWSALHGDASVFAAAEQNPARALFGNGAAHASMLPVESEQYPTERKRIRRPEVGDICANCDVLAVPGASLR